MGELFRRIYYLLHRRKLEQELQSDMDAHREMLGAIYDPGAKTHRGDEQTLGFVLVIRDHPRRSAAEILRLRSGFRLRAPARRAPCSRPHCASRSVSAVRIGGKKLR